MWSASELVRAILPWYQANRRVLPWREAPSPYHVLLSELMLQQTRVDTVGPYFERFTARWPRLEDLAAASETEVLEAWAGLGYYRRARFLHRCAQAAVAIGGLPAEAGALAKLPGIGPYTAGAIASIAFGQPSPLVDGNVERVLCRVDGRGENPRAKPGERALWARAGSLHEALLEGEHPGDLNQALMELGATVCSPVKPRCERCPWAEGCVGRAEGAPERYPALPAKPKPVPVRGAALLVEGGGGLLLGRRREGELLGGLWEPLRVALAEGEQGELVLRARVERSLGVSVAELRSVGRVSHVFTHRKLSCEVFVGRLAELPVVAEGLADAEYEGFAYRDPEAGGLSKLAQKLIALGPGALSPEG